MPAGFDEKALLLWQRYQAELFMEWARTHHKMTMQQLGLKYDPNQPRVGAGNPAGGQWLGQNVGRGGSGGSGTIGDGDITGSVPKRSATQNPGVVAPLTTQPALVSHGTGRENLLQQAQFAPPMPMPFPNKFGGAAAAAPGAIQSAIDLFNYLTAQPKAGGPIVLELAPREYIPSATDPLDLAFVRSLSRAETKDYCPSIEKVQQIADDISKEVRATSAGMSPQQIGTEIHYQIAKYIRNHPDLGLEAEVTFNIDGPNVPGAKGSVRSDANEEAPRKALCMYDFKTGNEPLSPARSYQLVYHAFRVRGRLYDRYYIIEIRPQR